MQTIPYRTTNNLGLYDSIETFIVKQYGAKHFETIKDGLSEVQKNRNEVAQLATYDDCLLLDKYEKILIEYYKAANFLEKKFAFGDVDTEVKLSMSWRDSRTNEVKTTNTTLQLEILSVLYNLAAVKNNSASHTPLTEDNIKNVSFKFQEAAWTFDYIKSRLDDLPPSCRSHDFTAENLLYCSTVALAQSQYCFYKKAEQAGMGEGIMAKITNQLRHFFKDCQKYAKLSPTLVKAKTGEKMDFYVQYYYAMALFYKGTDMMNKADKDGEGMGAATAFLKGAKGLLEKKVCGFDTASKEAVKSKLELATKHFETAEDLNKNVYYEAVKLPEGGDGLECKNFTQYRSFKEDLMEPFPNEALYDIFIPIEVKKLEGEFHVLANKEINSLMTNALQIEEDFNSSLAKHGLPQAVYSVSNNKELPTDVWSRIEEFQKRGNLQALESLLAGVGKIREQCGTLIQQYDSKILEEETEDTHLKSAYGASWNRLQSSALNSDIKQRIASYKQNLA